jgi:hypothetical protein
MRRESDQRSRALSKMGAERRGSLLVLRLLARRPAENHEHFSPRQPAVRADGNFNERYRFSVVRFMTHGLLGSESVSRS